IGTALGAPQAKAPGSAGGNAAVRQDRIRILSFNRIDALSPMSMAAQLTRTARLVRTRRAVDIGRPTAFKSDRRIVPSPELGRCAIRLISPSAARAHARTRRHRAGAPGARACPGA